MAGKCPKCENTISNVDLQGPTIGNSVFGPLVPGMTAVCPRCRTVLGVTVDPVALKREIVKEVLQGWASHNDDALNRSLAFFFSAA
jgi:hypothetical protein